MNAVIIIPTYNESANIEALVYSVLNQAAGVHILIVDDNSPDGTGDIIDRLEHDPATRGRVHAFHRPSKMGVAGAYIQGFRWTIANGFDAAIQMDADFSHNPLYLQSMVEAADKADIVIGSRYMNGISVINWPLQRILLSWAANYYVQMITKIAINDCTSGFRLYSRHVLEQLDLDTIASNGYSFHVEMSYRAKLLGFQSVEVPIIFEERRSGQSKMSRKIIWEAAKMPIKLRLMEHRLRQKLAQNSSIDTLVGHAAAQEIVKKAA